MQINLVFTLIPIKPLGLIVHGLCFLGVNVFAIECILANMDIVMIGVKSLFFEMIAQS